MTISEEICKSAGIEPKIFYECTKYEGAGIYKKIFHEFKTEHDRAIAIDSGLKLKKIIIYPDFENNNNNFVKLLDVIINSGFIIEINKGEYILKPVFSFWAKVENSLIKCVLVYLKYDFYSADKDELISLEQQKNQFKQALQQTEWEY